MIKNKGTTTKLDFWEEWNFKSQRWDKDWKKVSARPPFPPPHNHKPILFNQRKSKDTPSKYRSTTDWKSKPWHFYTVWHNTNFWVAVSFGHDIRFYNCIKLHIFLRKLRLISSASALDTSTSKFHTLWFFFFFFKKLSNSDIRLLRLGLKLIIRENWGKNKVGHV